MKDVKVITEKGRTSQAIALFGNAMMQAGAEGWTLQRPATVNANMTFTTITATLEKELTGEQATDKVIEEVPSIGSISDVVGDSMRELSALDAQAAPLVGEMNTAMGMAGAQAALEEGVALATEFKEKSEELLSVVDGVSAEAIVELNGLTKKAQMKSWCKRNNITLAEVPNQAAAMKKAILDLVDPE